MLVAKDPLLENVVQINDLPAPEYGFIVSKTVDQNGNVVDETTITDSSNESSEDNEGTKDENNEETDVEKPVYTTTESDFYLNASDITMTKDMGNIYLVSKVYRDLRIPLSTSIIGTLDESKLIQNITYEAESAKIYKDDVLLTQEELQTLPNAEKPFLSNYGTSPISESDANKLSGGVCLRSFTSNNMKVEFEIVSSKAQEVDLTVKVCKRTKAATFDSSFAFTVNGQKYSKLNSQMIDAGVGYYQPFELQPVKIKLNRGINHLVFKSGSKVGTRNPVNLDAIVLNATENSIGLDDSIVPLQ